MTPNEKLIIYTAIVDGKDRLQTPRHLIPNADYVCFTNTPELCSPAFTIRPLPFTEASGRLTARKIKLLTHELFPDHQISVWIDGSKQILQDITPLIKTALDKHDIACLSHPERNCVYQEIDACLALGRDNSGHLQRQRAHYHQLNVPENIGLVQTGIMFRKHNKAIIIDLMKRWWEETQRFSDREQVSFPIMIKEKRIDLHTLEHNVWHDKYFLQKPHLWHPEGDDRNTIKIYLLGHISFWLKRFHLYRPIKQCLQHMKVISE